MNNVFDFARWISYGLDFLIENNRYLSSFWIYTNYLSISKLFILLVIFKIVHFCVFFSSITLFLMLF
jgi:hypothetical protein